MGGMGGLRPHYHAMFAVVVFGELTVGVGAVGAEHGLRLDVARENGVERRLPRVGKNSLDRGAGPVDRAYDRSPQDRRYAALADAAAVVARQSRHGADVRLLP